VGIGAFKWVVVHLNGSSSSDLKSIAIAKFIDFVGFQFGALFDSYN